MHASGNKIFRPLSTTIYLRESGEAGGLYGTLARWGEQLILAFVRVAAVGINITWQWSLLCGWPVDSMYWLHLCFLCEVTEYYMECHALQRFSSLSIMNSCHKCVATVAATGSVGYGSMNLVVSKPEPGVFQFLTQMRITCHWSPSGYEVRDITMSFEYFCP